MKITRVNLFRLTLLLVFSSHSFTALAASPFLVNYSSLETGGGRAMVENPGGKSTTLAESLVQMRKCSNGDHIGSHILQSNIPLQTIAPNVQILE